MDNVQNIKQRFGIIGNDPQLNFAIGKGEGVDQTRGWFYTLHTIATLVFDS